MAGMLRRTYRVDHSEARNRAPKVKTGRDRLPAKRRLAQWNELKSVRSNDEVLAVSGSKR